LAAGQSGDGSPQSKARQFIESGAKLQAQGNAMGIGSRSFVNEVLAGACHRFGGNANGLQ
jgi:hypothetical protein